MWVFWSLLEPARVSRKVTRRLTDPKRELYLSAATCVVEDLTFATADATIRKHAPIRCVW